jgi:hypothetical protein
MVPDVGLHQHPDPEHPVELVALRRCEAVECFRRHLRAGLQNGPGRGHPICPCVGQGPGLEEVPDRALLIAGGTLRTLAWLWLLSWIRGRYLYPLLLSTQLQRQVYAASQIQQLVDRRLPEIIVAK